VKPVLALQKAETRTSSSIFSIEEQAAHHRRGHGY
jgi:hypothetical protein